MEGVQRLFGPLAHVFVLALLGELLEVREYVLDPVMLESGVNCDADVAHERAGQRSNVVISVLLNEGVNLSIGGLREIGNAFQEAWYPSGRNIVSSEAMFAATLSGGRN